MVYREQLVKFGVSGRRQSKFHTGQSISHEQEPTGNSWDGQVDKYIPTHIFALKLSKASWKAGRTKETEERCSSGKREKPK